MSIRCLQQLPNEAIASLENKANPFYQCFMTFLAAVFARHFIESFSQEINLFDLPSILTMVDSLHYTLSFMAITLLLAIMLFWVVGHSMEKILRVLCCGSLVILLGPIIDLVVYGSQGSNLLYIEPTLNLNVWKMYVTYFGDFVGVSIGLKIEIALVIVGLIIYARVKACGWAKSVFVGFAAYTLIFLWGCSPYLVKFVLAQFGFEYSFSSALMLYYYMFLNLFLFLLTAYLLNSSLFMTLVKDLRGLRISYYELNLLLGVSLGLSTQFTGAVYYFHRHADVAAGILLAVISVFFACVSALMINNISDVDIDRISNPDRPLIAGGVSLVQYKVIAYILMGVSLFYASISSAKTFLVVASMMGSYYVYSVPPVRFKRALIFSKLVIGFNSFAMVVLGFVLVQQNMIGFNKSIVWIYIVGITLAANFIDLKDVSGDRAAGILTLPVWIGERLAKLFISVALFFLSLSFYFIFNDLLLLPVCLISGGLYIYLVNKSVYRDRQILWLCNINFILMIAYLLWGKQILH